MILPRQGQSPSLTSTTTANSNEPPDPTVLPPSTNRPHTALDGWQIALIVIGGLVLIGLLGTLFILVRTRLTLRRAASTSRFDYSGSTNGLTPGATGMGEFAIGGGGGGSSSTGRRGSNAPSDMKRERRASVVEDAKLQIRRLIKKTRPNTNLHGRARSSSYPAGSPPSPPYKSKTGLDFGLSPLRFGGGSSSSNTEKDADHPNGSSGRKKGRRKSQNGLDVRIRSADDHATEDYGYGGRAPFMKNENATPSASASGSGFRIGSAGSGSNLISAPAPRHGDDDDAFLTGFGRPGGAGRGRDSVDRDDWGYGDHSIAHTVRGSFEDAEEEERQRAIAQQHHHLGAAVERLAAERNWTGHDRGVQR